MHLLTKAEFSRYTSTEQDTHKPKIPRRVWMVAGMALVVVGLLWWVNARVSNLAKPATESETSGALAQPVRTTLGTALSGDLTHGEYLSRLAPRHVGMPYSAPIYDEREAVAKPEVYCMTAGAGLDASGEHLDASHVCITEQGTRYNMPPELARELAERGGLYNPFRDPQQPVQASGQPAGEPVASERAADTVASVPAHAESSGVQSIGAVAAYGGFRDVDPRPLALSDSF